MGGYGRVDGASLEGGRGVDPLSMPDLWNIDGEQRLLDYCCLCRVCWTK